MMGFLRGIFAAKREAGTRTVAGAPVTLNVQDAVYSQNSLQRLAALKELYFKYKTTPHANKINAVYEKTQHLHTYLLSRAKAHELELFHLQHTDNFLNTFSVIIDMHRQHGKHRVARPALNRPPEPDPFRKGTKEAKEALQQNMEMSRTVLADAIAAKLEVPRLGVMQVSINTYCKLIYLQESMAGSVISHEIGYTSSPEEKEEFATYVSVRLGLEEVAYVGNALVSFPDSNGHQLPELAPVIQVKGCSYIFSIEKFHLFPVRTYAKNR
ncbi:hypothetical protein [Pontibacter arcticus]|nr:hypothetical protein [Pontibacter arcticus]